MKNHFTKLSLTWSYILVALVLCVHVNAQEVKQAGYGLAYTPEQMAARLIEIAEGPVPKRSEIEHEFGVKLELRFDHPERGVSYFGYAPSPFAAKPSDYPESAHPYSNISFNEMTRQSESIVDYHFQFLKFEKYSIYFRPLPLDKFCVKNKETNAKLSGRWLRYRSGSGGALHGVPFSFFYEAVINGVARKVVLPPSHFDEHQCLDGITISYRTPLAKRN